MFSLASVWIGIEVVIFIVLAIIIPRRLERITRLQRLMPKVVLWMMLGPALALILPKGWILPATVILLKNIGFFGLQNFGYSTGMHLRPQELWKNGKHIITLGAVSFLIPACGGFLISSFFVNGQGSIIGPNGNPLLIQIIIGILTGVTALPVLSAILILLGLNKTLLGRSNIAMATLHDFILWPLVGVIIVAGSGVGHSNVTMIIGGILLYLLCMFFPVRWGLARLGRVMLSRLGDTMLAGAILFTIGYGLMWGSSYVTEWLGVHFLLGAVVAGAILPEQYKKVSHWLEKPTLHIFLPFFIVTAGLGVSLGTGSQATWLLAAMLITVNLVFQFGVTPFVGRYFTKLSWRHSLTITTFMTCKGIVEFALAKILFDAGVIGTDLYNAAIIMAVVLTAITAPLAWWFLKDEANQLHAQAEPSGSDQQQTQLSLT